MFAAASDEIQQDAAAYLADWREWTEGPDFANRLAAMRASNPIIIARNHRVEQALASANQGDLDPLHRLCDALAQPFDEPKPGDSELETPPLPEERVLETYCNT